MRIFSTKRFDIYLHLRPEFLWTRERGVYSDWLDVQFLFVEVVYYQTRNRKPL